MPQSPDLANLSQCENDALIISLLARLAASNRWIAALEARLDEPARPPKSRGN